MVFSKPKMELPSVAHFCQEKIHFLKKMLSISIWGKIAFSKNITIKIQKS